MQKVSFKNTRGLSLIGHLYTGESEAGIVLSHAFTSDKSGLGRFDTLAEALNQSGYTVLPFDFSGCGESDDDTLTVDKHVDDLKAAIAFVKSKGCKTIGLLGHSLGGLISLKCYTPDIATMVLWAPVTDKVNYTWDSRYSEQQLRELNEKGYTIKVRNKDGRKRHVVDKQMLKDRENVNQKELLRNIGCPVLIIHGKEDEIVPYTDSERAIRLLSKDSSLEPVENASHGFFDNFDTILKLSNEWFLTHLQP